jgi:hypothetical protein
LPVTSSLCIEFDVVVLVHCKPQFHRARLLETRGPKVAKGLAWNMGRYAYENETELRRAL